MYAPGGEDFLKNAAETVNLNKEMKILEVGASAGFGSIFLAKNYGVSVTATDINPAWIPIIRERVKSEKVNRKITAGAEDVLKMSFRKGTFDAVLANGVLYLTDKAGALRQINRVLKKDGLVILGDPVWISDNAPLSLRRVLEVDGAEILTMGKYEQLFKENGFDLVLKKVYPSLIWENYYGPLQEKLTEWQKTGSANLTKYSTEIDFVVEEMTKVRELGTDFLGYGMLVGKKTAEATIDLL